MLLQNHFVIFSSGENNPKTDEPEPDMAAYMAPLLYNSFFISSMTGYCGKTLFSKSLNMQFFHSLTGRLIISFNE